jgi:hypothetical protein
MGHVASSGIQETVVGWAWWFTPIIPTYMGGEGKRIMVPQPALGKKHEALPKK